MTRNKRLFRSCRPLCLCAFVLVLAAVARAEEQAPPPPPYVTATEHVTVRDVALKGTIAGENISFRLDFTAVCEKDEQSIVFVAGDVALEEGAEPRGYVISYEKDPARYVMRWPRKGTYPISLNFAARPKLLAEDGWREVSFSVPASRVRELNVECDRTDLEVRFPGALRVTREVKAERLTVTALLGPGLPFAVRWKPQVEQMDGALVLSSDANTIVTVRAGALRLDSLFIYDIAQGKLNEVSFLLPKDLSVTQVRGAFIRDWRVEGEGDARRLRVTLNRPLTKDYALQVVAEMPLPAFPTDLTLPALRPEGVIRAGGHVTAGTDSAIHMVVEQAGGLTQTEPAGFPRVILDLEHPRALPSQKALFYSYATTPYQLKLSLNDVSPSFDVLGRCVITVREEDLAVEVEFELDVRDAPLRDLVIAVPKGLLVSALAGQEVKDYTVREAAGDKPQEVVVTFTTPLLGRALIQARLELGRTPLGAKQLVGGIAARGAKSERGYLAVAADPSVQIETAAVNDLLREVHTGSIPMRVPNAQFAWRFREPGWTVELLAARKPAGVLAESFHVVSLGDGALYGYVVVNFLISGAPVDEFRFRVPKEIENVEFVGGDVRRWSREGDIWTVKLQRKVIGDYNLAIAYSRPWKPGEALMVGGVECEGMERQSGFICVASNLNARLLAEETPDSSLLEIQTEEIPANYRLLLHAPILEVHRPGKPAAMAAWKFVSRPPLVPVKVEMYEQQSLLAAVVEVMDLSTELNVTDAGATESVTRVRYKVKNASIQFLSVTLPKDATVWSTRLIERDAATGAESGTRLTSALDRERGVLMVPLRRLRDPNEPMTVELVYGQVHPELQGGGRLSLTAPGGLVRTTFALWTVNAPRDWALLPSGNGTLAPKERGPEFRNLGSVLRAAARSWAWAFSHELPNAAPYYLLAGVLLVLAGLIVLRGRFPLLRAALLAMLLLPLFFLGVRAAGSPDLKNFVQADDLRTLTYTRALSLEETPALTVNMTVTPAWRRYATISSAVVVPLLGLAALLLALRRRAFRPLLAAVGVACLLTAAARFPALARVLTHALTWGLPVLLALWLVPRLALPVRRVAPALATLLLLVLMTGCAAMAKTSALPAQATVNELAYTLKAEKDSMEVTVRMKLSSPAAQGEMRVPLLPASAILLSPEKPMDGVELVRTDGGHDVVVSKAGVYEFDVRFLYPLAAPADNQVRRFDLAVPRALRVRAELTLPEKGFDVAGPTAVSFTRSETESATVAKAILGPDDPIAFLWRPRARERRLEETSFFADVLSLVRFDTGLARGRHRVRLQIAQGEIKQVRLRVPDNATVTAVEGENLGAWRFDPATHEIEARLTQPVGGEYVLNVTTQVAAEKMPIRLDVGTLTVLGAARQSAVLGLAVGPEVQIVSAPEGQAPSAEAGQAMKMNVDDFTREAAALLSNEGTVAVRNAYRVSDPAKSLPVDLAAVQPEVRSSEDATFTVSDERLVYNGVLTLSVTKAGVFSADLLLPEGYDIDTIASAEVSHWDEAAGEEGRAVQVHFRNRLLGATALKIALSRPIGDEMPESIETPRVRVRGSVKHQGQVSITSSRNVRLSVDERQGVSEISALDLSVRAQGAMAFKLLRPDWRLLLKTEVVMPRINVDFLHVAEISDGIVRHTHHLRYRFFNAGQKVLEIEVPKNALGLEITGPEIAHLKETEKGKWQVELAQKQFDQPYLLRVRFETQFDRAQGTVPLEPTRALAVDLQRGNVVVLSTDRVELSAEVVDEALQPADARALPAGFGAGELSAAAFCYACPAPDYRLVFRATRHKAASLLEASVLATTLDTVLSESGETITHVHMTLRIGSKRNLEVRLPAGAQVWSLGVNLRPEVPSRRRDAAGEEILLVPLAQGASTDLPAEVDLVYVAPPAGGKEFAQQTLQGPRFDLPLENITWRLFLPERFRYDNFGGTLNVNRETLDNMLVYAYDAVAYERNIAALNDNNRSKALQLQAAGSKLAKSGYQMEARNALSWANNYAYNDRELNEDTRVQLRSLMKQQAVVGLVSRRSNLRQQKGEFTAPQAAPAVTGVEFDQAQAERVQNSLNRDDSQNLDRITARLIEMQEEAARPRAQIMISLPVRGRLIELGRPLQVKPNADMRVTFHAEAVSPRHVKQSWAWGAGAAAVLLVLFLADRRLAAWRRKAAVVAQVDGEKMKE